MIQRIDANTEDIVDNVEGAQRELMKYWNRVQGNRWLVAKMFGVLMICQFFFPPRPPLFLHLYADLLQSFCCGSLLLDDFLPSLNLARRKGVSCLGMARPAFLPSSVRETRTIQTFGGEQSGMLQHNQASPSGRLPLKSSFTLPSVSFSLLSSRFLC